MDQPDGRNHAAEGMSGGDGADRQLTVEGNERARDTAGFSGDRIEEERGDESFQNNDQPEREPEFGDGIIEISGKGFGFLRDAKRNFVQTPQDIFVTPEIVRRFSLRDGMWIQGETRRGNRGPQLMRLNKINDEEPTKYQGLLHLRS